MHASTASFSSAFERGLNTAVDGMDEGRMMVWRGDEAFGVAVMVVVVVVAWSRCSILQVKNGGGLSASRRRVNVYKVEFVYFVYPPAKELGNSPTTTVKNTIMLICGLGTHFKNASMKTDSPSRRKS